MKKKYVLQTVLFIIAFVMMNQFANAQNCNGNKIFMCHCSWNCVVPEFKCVGPSSVQKYQSHGWFLCGSPRLSSNDVIPEDNSLNVFPNPVSETASILFSLAQSQKVSLQIFDLNARLVKTLADGEMKDGEYEIEWNASEANAGVYFLRMQTTEYLKMEKIIVTK